MLFSSPLLIVALATCVETNLPFLAGIIHYLVMCMFCVVTLLAAVTSATHHITPTEK